MDYTPEELEDLAIMRELRMRLRACAEARVAACEQMELPTNWLDVTRQCRGIMAVDRMVVMLFSPPPKPRTRRSTKSSGSADPLPPPHFPNGEVSAGASRRMTEGFSPAPDSARPLPEALPDEDAAVIAEATEKVAAAVGKAVRRYAEKAGVWPDGAGFDAGESEWHGHALTGGLALPDDDTIDPQAWLGEETLKRANAIARHRSGRLDSPDAWKLSVHFGTALKQPAGNEKPSPSCLPWWIVHNTPT